jgi:hypothetical protein
VDVFTLSGAVLANVVQGDNVLAVEVHQAALPDADVVFGTALSTPQLSPPLLTL